MIQAVGHICFQFRFQISDLLDAGNEILDELLLFTVILSVHVGKEQTGLSHQFDYIYDFVHD